jgi:hypothetical protein
LAAFMIGVSARSRVRFARFRAETLIMSVRTAFGGAARPTGQAGRLTPLLRSPL